MAWSCLRCSFDCVSASSSLARIKSRCSTVGAGAPFGRRVTQALASSRLLKFVFEGGGCATLIQDRALRRMKDSARPGPGFENFASFASIGVFQQPAKARLPISGSSSSVNRRSWLSDLPVGVLLDDLAIPE